MNRLPFSRYITILLFVLLFNACDGIPSGYTIEGVSYELARFRKENYSDVTYSLHFDIPGEKGTAVQGRAQIGFTLDSKKDIILDFVAMPDMLGDVVVNGRMVTPRFADQHIVIPRKYSRQGNNVVEIDFTAGDQSLNRRDEFLYTLLVPDRARTLFPCFEQPDLKARFTLSLEVPAGWIAVGNGSHEGEPEHVNVEDKERRTIRFRETEPISTYLFSFVCGRFKEVYEEENGRGIRLYHRETDPDKVSQIPGLFREVFYSLEWLEEYTGVTYPFEKYDLVILPGFQYGGMEHMGATLYNDRTMFLEGNATQLEQLKRSLLIAHETAHMWFGDYVTMKWFDEVWMKEVFANWFASQIVGPLYPGVDHRLDFIRNNVPAAYAEDRTSGTVPVRQQLGNLSDAGLVYGGIIYHKSPVIMEMLVEKVGGDVFRLGVQQYLREYGYGNAGWDELVAILDGISGAGLREWSDVWIREKGMPVVTAITDDAALNIQQSDPWERGVLWPQVVSYLLIYESGETETVSIDLTGATARYEAAANIRAAIPNPDGRAYGRFVPDDKSLEWLRYNWYHIGDDLARYNTLINLNENVLKGVIRPQAFFRSLLDGLSTETNLHIFRQGIAYASHCATVFESELTGFIPLYEGFLRSVARDDDSRERRITAAGALIYAARSEDGVMELYRIWDAGDTETYPFSTEDLTTLSYELAVHYPGQAGYITSKQLSRIINPDRAEEYRYISSAVDPSREKRDSVFSALLIPENRTVEPWAIKALMLLNHPLRQKEAVEYIFPALSALEDIQRTSDIFFPANWCTALFAGHNSREAGRRVSSFLSMNRIKPLLESKIRQRADHLISEGF